MMASGEMAMVETPQTQSRLSRVLSHWKSLAVILVVALVVLLHVVFVPVRITINITYIGPHSIHIIIDDNTVDYLVLHWPLFIDIIEAHTQKSYSVSFGEHTILVLDDGTVAARKVVVAWPFFGNSVDCTVSD